MAVCENPVAQSTALHKAPGHPSAQGNGAPILNKAPGIRDSIVDGADSVTALALDAF